MLSLPLLGFERVLIFHTHGYVVDGQALAIKCPEGNLLNVRPKTCQLLILLLKNTEQPLSKEQILNEVWAASMVADQVVFQSINEIRQLFGDKGVIKTLPKQGYLWLPTVSAQAESSAAPSKFQLKPLSLASLFFGVLVTLWMVLFFEGESSTSQVQGSVVVLPTVNQIQGNDHSWVRLGLMDQVIQRLPSSTEYGVLQTDYVLEVLKRAGVPRDRLLPEHIQQIFMVSGAEFIVSSKLIGTPHDYQLSYVFHFRNRLQKGILFNTRIQGIIDEFSQLIASQTGEAQLPLDYVYQADFNNELLGAAIENHLESKYELAYPMLKSIVLNNPENLTAQRILVGNLFRRKLFEQALNRIEIALPIAYKLKDTHEITRLMYSKSLYYYVTYNDAMASKVAEKALTYAKENNDWLFMAHITNIQAIIAINSENYALAESLYKKEKQYHQVLHCPVGEANAWASLAKLAKIQNNPGKFNNAINQAMSIASTRELTPLLSYYSKLKEKGI